MIMKPFDLKKLSERREELMGKLESMVQTCQTETRAFNQEEQTAYNDILTEVRSIDSTLDAAEQAQALSKVERRAAGGGKEDPSQEELETRAFECFIRGIAPELETREAVNMTVGDNGAVIPTSIANKIIEMVKEISPLYQLATHYDVGGTLTIPSYDESTQKITMAYATEFTALTSTSGKFTSISLSGFLAGALTKVSISLVNNSKFDIVSYVIRKMAEAAAEWIENELINGTTGKIEGLSTVAAAVTAAAETAVTSDELIDLQFARPPKEEFDCESICSTYSNLLNHPKLISWGMMGEEMTRRTVRKPVKKIALSKKTGLPIVERGETEKDEEEEEEEEEMEPVENLGAKRNKNETAEEKRLRKQKVKEAKSVGAAKACENRRNDSRKSS